MGLMSGGLRIASVGVAVMAMAVMMTGSPAAAISSGGIGGRPAHPDPNNPRTESIFVYTLGKGEAKTDQVKVINNTDTERTISLGAVDGIATNTGAYTCKQESEATESMGEWIKLAKNQVTLAPHTSELVDFTLTMPQTADAGEHNGCVTFQEVNEGEQAQNGVRVHMRQALRVAATVPGDLTRSISITRFNVVAKDGKRTYEVDLKNKGNVSADTDVQISSHGLFGAVAIGEKGAKTIGGTAPILAGQSYQTNFTESKPFFWGGWYQVKVTASYDKEIATIGTKTSDEKITRTDTKTIFIAPSIGAWLCIFVLLGLIVAAVMYVYMRARNRTVRHREWARYEVQLDDTIDSLAKEYAVSWKKLAAVNNLKAPYTLIEGQKLLVPPKAKRKS